ncbi:DUF4169 family protein [Yoonia sp.]|uniref:DUF4169 family protein n=1 Tax=Yoonia sp. TaxID=2212373 RepID=UPI00391A3C5A
MKPVNLNKARKERDRAADKARADENAIRFGRTKAERVLDAARAQQANNRLSQQKFEDD